VSRGAFIKSVQLLEAAERGSERYVPIGAVLCTSEAGRRCNSVDVAYSYREGRSERKAELRIARRFDRIEWTWHHRGHTIDFDFHVEPSPLAEKDVLRRRLVCGEEHTFWRSGCPAGKVTDVKVNGERVPIEPKPYHRLRIVFSGL
jgi:hypothetical protein